MMNAGSSTTRPWSLTRSGAGLTFYVPPGCSTQEPFWHSCEQQSWLNEQSELSARQRLPGGKAVLTTPEAHDRRPTTNRAHAIDDEMARPFMILASAEHCKEGSGSLRLPRSRRSMAGAGARSLTRPSRPARTRSRSSGPRLNASTGRRGPSRCPRGRGPRSAAAQSGSLPAASGGSVQGRAEPVQDPGCRRRESNP
jgi:hypothetical protein